MTNLLKILGNRLVIKRQALMETTIALPASATRREPFLAIVIAIGQMKDEVIQPGVTVLCEHCQSQAVIMDGKPLELISALDVLAVWEPA